MESLEEVQIRHRKEQKDLQAKVTQKKKNASKKTRKGVNTECEDLERHLKERQVQEIQALNGGSGASKSGNSDETPEDEFADSKEDEVNVATDRLAKATLEEEANPSEEGNQPRKRNRQKDRLARRAAEQEAAVEAAKVEAANQPNPKALEREKLLKEFKTNNRQEKLIRPDGHCLFSAVADQLEQAGISLGGDAQKLKEDQKYKVVRKAAADYIEGHPDDFVAWLEEPLEGYVKKIRDTAEWGGHLELSALAKTYNVEICVLRNGGKQIIEPGLGGKEKPEKIWLAYYLHGFGLGEHYNSLREAP